MRWATPLLLVFAVVGLAMAPEAVATTADGSIHADSDTLDEEPLANGDGSDSDPEHCDDHPPTRGDGTTEQPGADNGTTPQDPEKRPQDSPQDSGPGPATPDDGNDGTRNGANPRDETAGTTPPDLAAAVRQPFTAGLLLLGVGALALTTIVQQRRKP